MQTACAMPHWSFRLYIPLALSIGMFTGIMSECAGDDFVLRIFKERCVKCHGGDEVNAELDLRQVIASKKLIQHAEAIDRVIDVLRANDMPPESEPQLDEEAKAKLIGTLKAALRAAAANQTRTKVPMRRLNRFQYNNTVRDLFQLKRDVFALSEKLMTRHDNYLQAKAKRLPERIRVASQALKPNPGLAGVKPFPKDLRASHGFDNQANKLTLSPLLLDAFLRLSVSIVESPDFNEQSVGIWNDFFRAPAASDDQPAEIERRLEAFLPQAFRRQVDKETVARYTQYVQRQLGAGVSFTDAMKKVASAAMSSPLFLYRAEADDISDGQYALASRLSYFFWASCPDRELLDLAARGKLAEPATLRATIERMLQDPKIERFLDTFPTQWMQLENVLAATPDPKKDRYFHLDKNNPASLQMLIEPLLLFDAVLVENRPVHELISPSFSYRSDFLTTWYTTDLKPPPVDVERIKRENEGRAANLKKIQEILAGARRDLAEQDAKIRDPIGKEVVALDLSAGQRMWEQEQAKLVAASVSMSNWHRAGPFQATSFDEAHAKDFVNETRVDLKAKYGNLQWEEATQYTDGKVHTLTGGNSATYLYRTIHTPATREFDLSLGSDDSFKLWLNGQLVKENKVSRGVAPDQDKVRLKLQRGDNTLLFKIANGGGGHGFYFNVQALPLPGPVAAALGVPVAQRTAEQKQVLTRYYLGIAPELDEVRQRLTKDKGVLAEAIRRFEDQLKRAPKPQDVNFHRQAAQKNFENQMRGKLRSQSFQRVSMSDPRYGGVITNAAMLSMTSGPQRTHPIARGAWIIEVIFNDPPPPPPNDVPPLNEDAADKSLTIREKFAVHRENPSCAGCHSRLDPLGFAMENFDITGRWREKYENGRDVDSSGTLLRKHKFENVVQFKEFLVQERTRFARAFTAHLMRFALSRELQPSDSVVIDGILDRTSAEDFRLQSLLREVATSKAFVPAH